jgi:hypothetical protein
LLWSLHLITHTRWCGKQRGWWGWGRGIFWKLTQGVWGVGPRGVMIVWYWMSMISVGVWCHISTWHIIILTVGLIHLLCIWMWLLLLLSRYCIRYRIWTNTVVRVAVSKSFCKRIACNFQLGNPVILVGSYCCELSFWKYKGFEFNASVPTKASCHP